MRTKLMLVLLWSSAAFAQYSPIGDHFAGRSVAGGASSTGAFGASIPLALPPARGGLPVPLAVTFHGGGAIGEAGVGWSIPLSYVFVSSAPSHRKPLLFQWSGGDPSWKLEAATRVFLSLGGSSQLMNLVGPGRYRAMVEGAFLELEQQGDAWIAHDLSGSQYRFARIAGLDDDALFYLSSIQDASGKNSVELSYHVETREVPKPGQKELLLTQIAYSHLTATCPKYRVALEYAPSGTVGYTLDRGQVRVRAKLLQHIVVWAHANATCQEDASQILNSYDFLYSPDADTRRPRLAKVRVRGQGSARETDASRPISEYQYGSVAASGKLRFAAASSMTLPERMSLPASIGSVVEQAPGGTKTYRTQSMMRDFNGDGVPDLAFDTFLAVAGVGAGGTTFAPPAFLTGTALSSQTADEYRYTAIDQSNVVATWTRLVDWNGDGRVDLLNAKAGKDASGRPSRDYWSLLLNLAGTDGKPVWKERQIYIAPLRQKLDRKDVYELPISRSRSEGQVTSGDCWKYVLNGDRWVLTQCTANPSTSSGATITEWDVLDVNGDGFPDFVYDSKPVDFQITYKMDSAPVEKCPAFTQVCQATVPLGQTNSGADCPLKLPTDPRFAPQRTCSTTKTIALHDNQLMVSYNANGGGLTLSDVPLEFLPPVVLMPKDYCGVEQWTARGRLQLLTCGFADVNGDGLVDRIAGTSVALNRGNATDGPPPFGGSDITLPDFAAITDNLHFAVCSRPGASPPPTPTTPYQVRRTAALIDVNADGLPDYVKDGKVQLGTGTGFGPALPLESPIGFEISSVEEHCGDGSGRTIAGLVDVDGDGRLEVVRVGSGRTLQVARLLGDEGPAVAAGRITRVKNGYGGLTKVEYASAKIADGTSHLLPFPEIVVTSTTTETERSLGPSLAPVRYAYGGASLFYHPLLARWIFPGYSRRVVVGGLPDGNGWATVSAAYDSRVAQGIAGYALAGQVHDVFHLEGRFTQPRDLLSVKLSDSRVRGGTSLKLDVRKVGVFDSSGPECYDVRPHAAAPIGETEAQQLCHRAALVFPKEVRQWSGLAQPPSKQSVESFRSTAIDEFGRVTQAKIDPDTARPGDELCTLTNWAEPINTRVRDAAQRQYVTNCKTANDEVRHAGGRTLFDSLPDGQVAAGLPTRVVNEVYDEKGIRLGEFVAAELTYDPFGNPQTLISKRGDGVSRTIRLDYDLFGIAPLKSTATASDTSTSLQTMVVPDPVSLRPQSMTDANGVTVGFAYDVFGRPRRTVLKSGANDFLLSETFRQDAPDDPKGMSITSRSYVKWVASGGPRTPDTYIETTAWLDELGRLRYVEVPLGADHGNRKLVTNYVERDALGRPTFAAAPFHWEDATRYGTSFHYGADGLLRCAVDGVGLQPLRQTSDPSADVYATCVDHRWEDHQLVVASSGPEELTPRSPAWHARDEVRLDAAGRPLSSQRLQVNDRHKVVPLERTDFGYDRLGHRRSISRWSKPENVSAVKVTWTFEHDSLGRIRDLSEPGTALQRRQYDEWNQLVETTWRDPRTLAVLRKLKVQHDGFGRMIRREVGAGQVARFTYDGSAAAHQIGRLRSIEDDRSTVSFEYDALGNAQLVDRFDKPGNRHFIERYQYVPGSLSVLELGLPNGTTERAEYFYDSLGAMKSVRFQGQPLFEAEADDFGRYSWIRSGKDILDSYRYRPDRRRELQSRKIASSVQSYEIEYPKLDSVGRLKERVERSSDCPGCAASVERLLYDYDARGKLSRLRRLEAGPVLLDDRSFQFDALGNLTEARALVAGATVTRTFVADPADPDRLARISSPWPGRGTTTYQYDGFGNVKSMADSLGTRTFVYDDASRLVHVEAGDHQMTLQRSALGDVAEVEVSSPARHERHFGLVSELQLPDGWNLERRIPGPGGAVAIQRGSLPVLFPFAEGGGTRWVKDASGRDVQAITYGPFGDKIKDSGQAGTAYYVSDQWNGGDFLGGLVDLGARTYDPNSGRFLQRDPIRTVSSSSRLNPYTFALGDPVNFADPSGLDANCDPLNPVCTTNAAFNTVGSLVSTALGLFQSLRHHGGSGLEEAPKQAAIKSIYYTHAGEDLEWLRRRIPSPGDFLAGMFPPRMRDYTRRTPLGYGWGSHACDGWPPTLCFDRDIIAPRALWALENLNFRIQQIMTGVGFLQKFANLSAMGIVANSMITRPNLPPIAVKVPPPRVPPLPVPPSLRLMALPVTSAHLRLPSVKIGDGQYVAYAASAQQDLQFEGPGGLNATDFTEFILQQVHLENLNVDWRNASTFVLQSRGIIDVPGGGTSRLTVTGQLLEGGSLIILDVEWPSFSAD